MLHIKKFSPFLVGVALLGALTILSNIGGMLKINSYILSGALLLVTSIYLVNKNNRFRRKSNKTPLHYITAGLLLALATFLFYASPLLINPSGDKIMGYHIHGFDDMAHESLIRNNLDHGGPFYRSYQQNATEIEYSLSGYPQGWHFLSSIIYQPAQLLIEKLGVSFAVASASAFTLVNILWAVLLTFSVFFLILQLVRIFAKTSIGAITHPGIYYLSAAFAFLVNLFLIFEFYVSGYASFIGNLVFWVGLLGLVLYFIASDEQLDQKTFLLLAICMIAGLTGSWILTAPVGFILILSVLRKQILPNKWSIQGLYTYLKTYYFAIILAVLSILPILFNLAYSNLESNINIDGGITRYSLTLVFVLISIVVITIPLLIKPAINRRYMLIITLLPALIWVTTGVYQLASAGGLTYYFYKTGYVFIFSMSIYVVSTLAYFIYKHYLSDINLHGSILSSGAIIIVGIFVLPINQGLIAEYYSPKKYAPKFITEQGQKDAITYANAQNEGENVVYFKGDTSTEDLFMNQYLASISPRKNEYRQLLGTYATNQDYKQFSSYLYTYANASSNPVKVVTTEPIKQRIIDNLPAEGSKQLSRGQIIFTTE